MALAKFALFLYNKKKDNVGASVCFNVCIYDSCWYMIHYNQKAARLSPMTPIGAMIRAQERWIFDGVTFSKGTARRWIIVGTFIQEISAPMKSQVALFVCQWDYSLTVLQWMWNGFELRRKERVYRWDGHCFFYKGEMVYLSQHYSVSNHRFHCLCVVCLVSCWYSGGVTVVPSAKFINLIPLVTGGLRETYQSHCTYYYFML